MSSITGAKGIAHAELLKHVGIGGQYEGVHEHEAEAHVVN